MTICRAEGEPPKSSFGSSGHCVADINGKKRTSEIKRLYKGSRKAYNSRSEFTIFVDIIPHALDPFGLKGIFRTAGDMSDSYIPSRRGKRNRNRFGFIRFWNKRDALRSIITFGNTIIRGSRIKVTIA